MLKKAFVVLSVWIVIHCPLVANAARDMSNVKMVSTIIVGKVTDRYGHSLKIDDGVIKLELFKFFGDNWPEVHRATIVCRLGNNGEFRDITNFPVDAKFVRGMKQKLRGQTEFKNPLGFRVLNNNARPLQLPDGITITLTQIGRDPWPSGTSVIIKGSTDDQGYIRATVQFPVNAVVLNNLDMMAQGRGQ